MTSEVTNGHATIREVYRLTGEIRDELLTALEKMEGRLLKAIEDNRGERLTWIKSHENVHREIVTRHDEEDEKRSERVGQRKLVSGCVDFIEKHWKAILAGVGIGIAAVEFFSHVRLVG